jgi:hypothetical protein
LHIGNSIAYIARAAQVYVMSSTVNDRFIFVSCRLALMPFGAFRIEKELM